MENCSGMLQTRIYHSLQFDLATAGSDRICYLLMPEAPSKEELKWLDDMSVSFDCTIVHVSGFDWDDCFSPWPAEGLKKGEWFKGSAGMLFAVWTAHKSDAFSEVASVSGSMWYDGFPEWVAKHKVSPSVRKVYLSLGEREKNTMNARVAKVEDATREVAETIAAQQIPVVFEFNPGTHFSAPLPRLEKALASILSEA